MRYTTGRYEDQIDGYTAFIPAFLPYTPDFAYDDSLHLMLSEADRAISALDAMVEMLPNSDHFIWMLARKEALLSSQIEGTIATYYGVLAYEADISVDEDPNQLREVTNYLQALKTGLEWVTNVPISIDILCNLHKILLTKVRGAKALPGKIRPIQNQVGGDSLLNARYIPPPQENVRFLLNNLETFIAEETQS
jgi:Fic family protein